MIFQDMIGYIFTQATMASTVDSFSKLRGNLVNRLMLSTEDEFNRIDKIFRGLGIYIEMDVDDIQKVISDNGSGYFIYEMDKNILLYFTSRKKPLVDAIFKMYGIKIPGMKWIDYIR